MNQAGQQIQEIALRIREMRQIMGYSTAEMAIRTQLNEATYVEYESGKVDLPFTFIHKCALAFGIELTEEQVETIFAPLAEAAGGVF